MIRHVRVTVLMARPPVFMLLALYAVLRLARADRPDVYLPLGKALLLIAALFAFSAACNDRPTRRSTGSTCPATRAARWSSAR